MTTFDDGYADDRSLGDQLNATIAAAGNFLAGVRERTSGGLVEVPLAEEVATQLRFGLTCAHDELTRARGLLEALADSPGVRPKEELPC